MIKQLHKRIVGFSLAEILIVLSITVVMIICSVQVITSNPRVAGQDNSTISCIKNDLAKNPSLDISKTACSVNSVSACCKSIIGCLYNQSYASKNLSYYADYGTSNEQNNARKVLREVCDRGGENACKYFATSCQRDNSVCNIPGSENDLYYYLNLLPDNSSLGKVVIIDILKNYYALNYKFIKEALNSACCNPNYNTACLVKGISKCPVQIRVGGAANDNGSGIVLDSQGYIYIGGDESSDAGGIADHFLVKFDTNGNIVWQKKLGGSGEDNGTKLTIDSNDYLYLSGRETSDTTGAPNYDTPIFKLDSSGNIVWQKKIGGTGYENDTIMVVDSGGNLLLSISQNTETFGINYDWGLVKVDTNGNLMWQKKIGGTADDSGNGVAVDSSKNIYMVGRFQAATYDIGVMKLDNDGNIIWQKYLGGTNADSGNAIGVDKVGSVYISGYQNSDTLGVNDAIVAKFDTNGNLAWQKKIGGTGDDYLNKIFIDKNGSVFLSGYQNSDTFGNSDVAIVKLDTNGNLIWQKKIEGSAADTGRSIITDNAGDIYFTTSNASDTFGSGDLMLIKMPDTPVSNMALNIANSSLSTGTSSLSIANSSLNYTNTSFYSIPISLNYVRTNYSGFY